MKVEMLVLEGDPIDASEIGVWSEELGILIRQSRTTWPESDAKAISLLFRTEDRFDAIAGGGFLERKIRSSQPDKRYQVTVDGILLQKYAIEGRPRNATRRK